MVLDQGEEAWSGKSKRPSGSGFEQTADDKTDSQVKPATPDGDGGREALHLVTSMKLFSREEYMSRSTKAAGLDDKMMRRRSNMLVLYRGWFHLQGTAE